IHQVVADRMLGGGLLANQVVYKMLYARIVESNPMPGNSVRPQRRKETNIILFCHQIILPKNPTSIRRSNHWKNHPGNFQSLGIIP
ncbi:MAG: hypothetical protein K9M45_13030, partial [Kiritimatiellales bacterium]|nr:hypothetical protein [Kiritimatiellales bacterium]